VSHLIEVYIIAKIIDLNKFEFFFPKIKSPKIRF